MDFLAIIIALLSLLTSVFVIINNSLEEREHKNKTNKLIKVKIKRNQNYIKSNYNHLYNLNNDFSNTSNYNMGLIMPYYIVDIGNKTFLYTLKILIKDIEEYYLNNSKYELNNDAVIISLIENLQFVIDSLDNFTETMDNLMVEYDKAVQLDIREENPDLWIASHLKYDGSPGRTIVTPIMYYNKEFSSYTSKMGIENFYQAQIAFMNKKFNPHGYATIGELMMLDNIIESLNKIINDIDRI
ncbi:hypothetical protein [Macrococcoides canis]|uniref:hypothetical protein n=1 Tax=Macrococcoides canis TaxID=1855823 RepID=UPI0020B8FEE8|nr:hypothetical protein [Macrococcus canis]UTG99648.1 hypothetical protein KFV04_09140 [Macrococcus canis]